MMYYGSTPDDYEYAVKRLQNTIVKVDDKLVVVFGMNKNVSGKMICSCQGTLGDSFDTEMSNIDLSPIELGWTFKGIYLSRKPLRKAWKQGICQNSLVSYKIIEDQIIIAKHSLSDVINLLSRPFLGIEEALALNKKSKITVGINNKFSLGVSKENASLFFNRFRVGLVDKVGKVTLDSNYSFLKEAVEKVFK